MLVVDAQVHIWTDGEASPHHRRMGEGAFTAEAMLAQMAAAGVHGTVLAPPSWDPGGNAPSLKAARQWPNRFTVTGDIAWAGQPDRQAIRRWRDEPGMSGLRLIFNNDEKQAALAAGQVEWIWEEAERADLPVMLLIPGGVHHVADIARRFPGLRLCVDHLAIPRGAKDAAAFEHLPQLLALAKLANVSVKAGGLNTYSTTDGYPYRSLHGYWRQAFDAFGPERIFWASDLTRMSCSYAEVVRLVAEDLPWLSDGDRRLIMGEAVCRWLDWQPAAAAAANLRREKINAGSATDSR